MRILFTSAILASLLCHVTNAVCADEPSSHAAVERFLDVDSAFVAWTDVSQIDAESVTSALREFDDSTPPPDLDEMEAIRQAIVKLGVTRIYTVPSLFQQMMARGALADRDLSAVRWVLPAGEVYPPEPLRSLAELFPNARFSNVYGPAEVNQCSYHHFGIDELDDETLPIGLPCPDAELRVVDEDDREVADGERGELLVRTATMKAGYWKRPDLDEAGFLYEKGQGGLTRRWYRTGDLVHWDARGRLRYHGRRDHQIKIRGNRVELELVEAAVGSLDGVEQAVAGVRPKPGGDDELVARFVPSGPTDPSSWRQLLAAKLPMYAIPAVYEPAERFPLTPSGKIDRRTVREQIASDEVASER